MWPLLVCSVALFGLLLDRVCAFSLARGPTRALTEELELRLRAGDLEDALSVAASTRGPFARVAMRVLREALGPTQRADAARSEALAIERPPLERNLGWLRAIAALAILFGLLGTITGLNVGFTCVANADATSKAAALAKGISESMNCSAFGLLLATVALAGYFALRYAIDARLNALAAESRTIVNLLVTYRARIRFCGLRPQVEAMGYRR
ncbi:MAG: MotA/TolQ/ExbB proton channel family protein [Sandaracinaceae bacterium]|nr:MotA/TolQ/ExbB proton channel family protein [Sandaracinaceae bacterium]